VIEWRIFLNALVISVPILWRFLQVVSPVLVIGNGAVNVKNVAKLFHQKHR
jgi:uncharacterized membrane protein YcaP (DUF421 family)